MALSLTFAFRLLAAPLLMFVMALNVCAADSYDYHLQPREIASGTYVLIGRTEDFNAKNGGNIVNTGFIVTSAGVVVIDTGPSKRYGEQLRAAIVRLTSQPIVKVFNTHHHPDHMLGNQVFGDVGVTALPATIQGEKTEGAAFADNMYRLTLDWAKDTELAAATLPAAASTFVLGDHAFVLLALAGHSPGDLALLDTTTGVLFSGDLVFNGRTPTMPHADVGLWLASLDRLDKLDFKILVPGHGEVMHDKRAISETRDYLTWLSGHLEKAVDAGQDITDALADGPPERFAELAVLRDEYRRSVLQLYPRLEAARLPKRPAMR